MKKALKVTFGTMLAASIVGQVSAYEGFVGRSMLTLTGTYTQASNNGLSFGDVMTAQPGLPLGFFSDGGRRAVFIDPDYEWDYAIGYSYHIPCTHTRFFMTYDHYRNNDDNNAESGFVRNLGVNGTPSNPFNPSSSTASSDDRSDEFRIGFAHRLGLNPRFHLDLSGFFEWDKVKRTVDEFAVDSSPLLGSTGSRTTENRLHGWGPGVGATAWFSPTCNLHWRLFMGAKTSLIWADNDYSQTAFHDGDLAYDYDPETSKSLVGKLDIKFGLNYCTAIHSDIGHWLVEAELGMRYVNLLNAFKNGNTAYNPPFPEGDNGNTWAANTGFPQDWGRMGPYLSFKVGGGHS